MNGNVPVVFSFPQVSEAGHLVPYVKSSTQPNATRVDTLSDKYPEAELDLKAQAHCQRGIGPRTELGIHTPIPRRDWQTYLANKENKTEIFKFVGEKLFIAKNYPIYMLLLYMVNMY